MPAAWQYGSVSASGQAVRWSTPARPEGLAAPHWQKNLAFQALVALAVIAAALLDPFQAAIGIAGLVGIVLVDTGVHAALAGGFLGIFRVHRRRIHRRAGWRRRRGRRRGFLLRLGFRGLRRCRCGGRRRGRSSRSVGSSLGLAAIVPLLAVERAGGLGRLIFRAAFLRGQSL